VGRAAELPRCRPAAFTRVHELGGYIAIVTNRLQSECADTEAVFKTHKLTYDAMLCRPDSPSDKNPRFAAVAAGTNVTGGTPRRWWRSLATCRRLPGDDAGCDKSRCGRACKLRREVSSCCNPICGWQVMAQPRISVFPKCYVDEIIDGRRSHIS
jgi:hypothetical protein